jgi:hypothetical protein
VQACYDLMEHYNIHAVCAYLPREFNLVADSLSKEATSAAVRAWAARRGIAATLHWEWREAQSLGAAHAPKPPSSAAPSSTPQ